MLEVHQKLQLILGDTYTDDCIYIVSDCERFVDKLSMEFWNSETNRYCRNLPEFYLHKQFGLPPVLKKRETTDVVDEVSNVKQQNEKPKQKDDFPIVGQKVVIDPDTITYCPILKDCFGKEVLVIAKYKYYNIDMVSVCLDEFSGVACVRADCCFPAKTEREKQIEKIYDLLIDWENLENIAEQLYNTGYLPVKHTNKD